METPYIGTYAEAPLKYGKYRYDEDWIYSDIIPLWIKGFRDINKYTGFDWIRPR